ncbi:MAG: DUF3368 domain-containing protein [Tepidisphaeraceae bacterium]
MGELRLLEQLFGQVVIPPAVSREIRPSIPVAPGWLESRPLTGPLPTPVVEAALDEGESEAIALSLELNADWLLLDELPARRLAGRLGVAIVGTLGILLLAKLQGFIPEIRPRVELLKTANFRVSPALLRDTLRDAGES